MNDTAHEKNTQQHSSSWWWCDDEDSFRSSSKTIQTVTSKGTKRANLMQDTNVHYHQIREFHRKKGCRTLGLLQEFNLVSLTMSGLKVNKTSLGSGSSKTLVFFVNNPTISNKFSLTFTDIVNMQVVLYPASQPYLFYLVWYSS